MIVEIEGQKVEVDDSFSKLSPEQQSATVDEIAKSLGAVKNGPESDQSKAMREDLAATSNNFFKDGAPVDSFMRGAADTASFGFSDEIAGFMDGMKGVLNPWHENFMDPKISSGIRTQRAFQTQREDVDPKSMLAGRVTGGLLGAGALTKVNAPFMATLPAEATLGAKVAQGAKAGALYSGLYGAGSGEDLKDRAEQATTGALTGAAIGGAVPLIAAGVKAVTKPVTDAVKGYFRPEQFANQKIAERLANDLKTPTQAADEMARNPGMNLADVSGDSTKNLLKTAANVPGRAQSKINARLTLRQMQQGDRIKSTVRRTLAEPDGYLGVIDDINTTARDISQPLFNEAYQIPVPFSRSLEEALDTPAGRRALATAERLAANEQQPFRHTFINEVDGTERLVPDTRGWEYIRQALDDMIETQRDPLRGNRLTNEGRILVGLQQRIFDEVRRENPVYNSALQVWSGAHRVENALESGREVLNQSPEATRRALQGLSEAEQQAYRIGVATAIRDKVGNGNMTHNALLKFFSSKDQIESLRAAFPSAEQFRAFREAMFAEAKKRQTYNVVKGNSTTAKQLADMADAGGLKDGVEFVQNASTGGLTSATLRWVGSRLKMLGGFTPEVADQVQRRLLTADPETVRNITNELMRINNRQMSADQRQQLVQRLITPVLAIEAQRANAQ